MNEKNEINEEFSINSVKRESDLKSNDKETVLSIERDHIDHVVRHFKDDVYCWDVVNEVIEDGNDPINEDKSNIYRKSNWYTACDGPDFISTAFFKAMDPTLPEPEIITFFPLKSVLKYVLNISSAK